MTARHNDNINDRILGGTRAAQVLVADFTHHRPGVYFEAGFALALGRVVTWTCRDDQFDQLDFDTRQYNHIKWSTPRDLREKLAARLRAIAVLPVKLGSSDSVKAAYRTSCEVVSRRERNDIRLTQREADVTGDSRSIRLA